MAYASIIEIVGIKELAEDAYDKFTEITYEFRASAEQAVGDTLHKFRDVTLEIFLFKDHCYLKSNDFTSLIHYIQRLRIRFFLSKNYFFRCVITEGDLGIKETVAKEIPNLITKSKFEIKSMEYSDISIRLNAMMERFKGIGIMLDTDKLGGANLNKFKTFTNFYITDVNNKKYQSFTDLSLDSNDELFDYAKEIFERMYYDKMYSKKLARFYIPLLINLAKNYDLTISVDKENSIGKILGKTMVTKNKDVSGFEFFFYMLIDRIFDSAYNSKIRKTDFEDELIQIEKNLAQNNWLLELLRNDSKFYDIPKEILTNSKRRVALRSITEVLHNIENNT